METTTTQNVAPEIYGYAVIQMGLGGKPMYGIARDQQAALDAAFEYAYDGSELDADERAEQWDDMLQTELTVIKLDKRAYELADNGGWDSIGFRENTETTANDVDFYVWVE